MGFYFGKEKTACVGRDTRPHATLVQSAVIRGLQSQGVNVVDCGCVPTPVLAHYISVEADCGIMITGSHLSFDMIGIIPLMGDGAYMPEQDTVHVEDIFYHHQLKAVLHGSLTRADDALDRYRNVLFSLVDTSIIHKNEFNIAVDPANGTASTYLADMLQQVGCFVTEINNQVDEQGRDPEPRAFTLSELSTLVKEGDYDVGVGFDSDADRVVFIDEGGTAVSEDVAGVIFADYVFLGVEYGTFVTPVNSSGIVEWFAQKRDVLLEYCKIGQPATVEAIKRLGAAYSYEESGKYYFSTDVNWCCGLLATLKMLEIMGRGDMPLSEIVKFYPCFNQVKKTLRLPEEQKKDVIAFIEQNIDGLGEGTARLVTLDGYKLIYPDHSWLLLRASGTEPVLRVYSDSPSKKRAEELVEKGLQFAQRAMDRMNDT